MKKSFVFLSQIYGNLFRFGLSFIEKFRFTNFWFKLSIENVLCRLEFSLIFFSLCDTQQFTYLEVYCDPVEIRFKWIDLFGSCECMRVEIYTTQLIGFASASSFLPLYFQIYNLAALSVSEWFSSRFNKMLLFWSFGL